MKTAQTQTVFFFKIIALSSSMISCANLDHINRYSESALAGVDKINDIEYDFTKYCRDRCKQDAIDSFRIVRKLNCSCIYYRRADSVTSSLQKIIKGYFSGLSGLSKKEITQYRAEPLKTEGSIFEIDKEEAEAYLHLSGLILRSVAGLHQRQALTDYIRSANTPLQVILSKLQFIESKNLVELLNFRKESLFEQYHRILGRGTLNDFEKGVMAADYFNELEGIDGIQKKLQTYSAGLKSIAAGHQKLADHLNDISSDDLKQGIAFSISEIQDLLDDFNKLNKP